jgi:hypothetical protein
LFNDCSAKSFQTLVETIQILKKRTKPQLIKLYSNQNWISEKTYILDIAKKNNLYGHLIGLKRKECIFTISINLILKFNVMQKMKEFKACLKQLQHRNLSVKGTVIVIKTFALPK